jgi:hypothetical protein
MNIRGGSKDRIDIKEEELKEELSKPIKIQNKNKIKRLEESIKRNKKISHLIVKKRR